MNFQPCFAVLTNDLGAEVAQRREDTGVCGCLDENRVTGVDDDLEHLELAMLSSQPMHTTRQALTLLIRPCDPLPTLTDHPVPFSLLWTSLMKSSSHARNLGRPGVGP